MSCTEQFPTYADILALKKQINNLEAKIEKKADKNSIKSFFIEWALGEGLSQISLEVSKSAPVRGALNAVAKQAASAAAGVLELKGTQKGMERALKEFKVGTVEAGRKVAQFEGQLTDVRKIANNANSAAATATTRAARASATATAATTAATGARAAFSNFLNLFAIVGGAAGLISLFGYFKAIRPQFAANERRLDAHDQAFSQVYNSLGRVDSRARAAQATANNANAAANTAQNTATSALTRANNAQATANTAQTTANTANRRINDVETKNVEITNQLRATDDAARRARELSNDAKATAKKAQETAETARREGLAMNQNQYTTINNQYTNISTQNQYITNLIQNLPTSRPTPLTLPPELLAMPVVLAGTSSEVRRIGQATNQIAQNTTPQAQQAAAAAGTCQTMQPGGCGDSAIARHTDPIRKLLGKLSDKFGAFNAGANAAILARVNVAIGKIDTLNTMVLDKFAKTWDFLKIDRVLNILSTAASIHNASMLSFNVLQSLGETMSAMLAMVGLKDAEGNPFSIGVALKNSVSGAINRVLGREAAQGISERWNQLNRIITAGSAVVMAIQSVQYAIAEGVEIIGGWVAHIGNGLRESGTVSDRQYPWMNAGIKIKRFSRLDKWNEGLESAENITNQVYATVSAGQEIAQTVGEVRQAKNAFETEFAAATTAADNDLTTRETESQSPDLDNLDLVKIEETE